MRVGGFEWENFGVCVHSVRERMRERERERERERDQETGMSRKNLKRTQPISF